MYVAQRVLMGQSDKAASALCIRSPPTSRELTRHVKSKKDTRSHVVLISSSLRLWLFDHAVYVNYVIYLGNQSRLRGLLRPSWRPENDASPHVEVNQLIFRSGNGELFLRMLLEDKELKPLRNRLQEIGYTWVIHPSPSWNV